MIGSGGHARHASAGSVIGHTAATQSAVFVVRPELPADLLRDADAMRRDLASSGQPWDDDLVASYAAGLGQAHPLSTSYEHVPAHCLAMTERIALEHGQSGVETFLRQVILHETLALPARLAETYLPASVVKELAWSVRDTLSTLRSPREGYFLHENDQFAKALAICRLRLIPCGVEMFEVNSALARSTLWTSGIAGGVAFARAWLAMGGHQPFLAGHWDRRRIRDFSVEGYRRMYRVAADLLEARPEFVGIGGRSWWFDPELKTISPELAFLREETETAGAYFIPAPTDEVMTAQALSFSRVRRLAYGEGRYTPRSYMWIWPRAAVLAWRARQPAL